jgi:hypothetical protein
MRAIPIAGWILKIESELTPGLSASAGRDTRAAAAAAVPRNARREILDAEEGVRRASLSVAFTGRRVFVRFVKRPPKMTHPPNQRSQSAGVNK